MNFNKEPAVLVGVALSIILAVIQQFAGGGIITADTAASASNIANAAAPFVLGIITRSLVFSPATVEAILLALGKGPDQAPSLAKQGRTLDASL